MRRTALVVGLALGLVAAGTAAGIVFAFRSDTSSGLSKAAYLERANAICASYSKRLDKIPPPLDPASPGAVYESISLALPLLRRQSREVHALVPPRELRRNVERFFVLTEQSLDHLQEAGRHARLRELFPMVQSLSAFGRVRDNAKLFSKSIGFKC